MIARFGIMRALNGLRQARRRRHAGFAEVNRAISRSNYQAFEAACGRLHLSASNPGASSAYVYSNFSSTPQFLSWR
jgi:hypothetical protein